MNNQVLKTIIIYIISFIIVNCFYSEKEYCERYYEDKKMAENEKCGGYLFLDGVIKSSRDSEPLGEQLRNEALYRCLNYFQMKKECGTKSEYLPYTGNKYR